MSGGAGGRHDAGRQDAGRFWVLGGNDAYLIDGEVDSILGSARRKNAPLLAEDFDPARLESVFGHLAAPSLFSPEPPVAVLSQADASLAGKPAERILAWSESGASGSLLLIAPRAADKEKGNAPLVRAAKAADRLRLLFRPSRPSDWIRWIRARCERYGLEIDDEVARALHLRAGEETGPLDREIEKLSLLGEKRIDRERLVEMVGVSHEAKVFEAIDAFLAGNLDPILSHLDEFTQGGKVFPPFIGALLYKAEATKRSSILADLARLDAELKSRPAETRLARFAVYLRRASWKIGRAA